MTDAAFGLPETVPQTSFHSEQGAVCFSVLLFVCQVIQGEGVILVLKENMLFVPSYDEGKKRLLLHRIAGSVPHPFSPNVHFCPESGTFLACLPAVFCRCYAWLCSVL